MKPRKSKQVIARIEPETKAQLELIAARKRLNPSDIVRMALLSFIQQSNLT